MQTCWRNVRRYCLKTGLSLTTTYETSGKVKFPKPILVLIRRLHEHDGQHHDGGFSCRQSFDHAGDAHLGLEQVGAMVQVETIPSILSLSGFALATLSAILAVSSIAYAQVHRFGFYDPSLMKIMRWGSMLSLAGFLFAVGGAWRKSPLRWHAPVCALGTFAFWVLAAEGE
jgi:hypothetical protein